MPSVCCAVGCDNNKGKIKDGFKFYRIPKEITRRNKWIAAIKRDHWTPTEHSRLCSAQFVTGKKLH